MVSELTRRRTAPGGSPPALVTRRAVGPRRLDSRVDRVYVPAEHDMRPLVAVRSAAGFRGDFLGAAFERAAAGEPLFRPLARAAKALSGFDDFPPIEALSRVFSGEPPVRFVPAAPRRRRGAPLDTRALYDARITLDREVPTRERCWHDLMNVLVWGTFPRAKMALHARQHRAIVERLVPGTCRLPPARTPELDALALLDEGGVILPRAAADDAGAEDMGVPIVFGHAIYESLVLGVAPAIVAAIALRVDDMGARRDAPTGADREGLGVPRHAQDRAGLESDVLAAVDRALSAVIEDATSLRAPTQLKRVRITTAQAARTAADG